MIGEGGQTQKTTHCAATRRRTSRKGHISGVGRGEGMPKGPRASVGTEPACGLTVVVATRQLLGPIELHALLSFIHVNVITMRPILLPLQTETP